MYCAKCGVELANTEAVCPLCQTPAHPDLYRAKETPLFPKNEKTPSKVNSQGMQIMLTALFLLPILICLQCDLLISGSVTWSGFVVGALMMVYIIGVLPVWFHKPNPVIFVPCSFAAVGVYLLYINLSTNGSWFLSFAFPVVGALCLIVTAVVTLMRYVRRGRLYIFGGSIIALGAFMPLMGFLINLTFFHASNFALWSLYPMTALVFLGCLLIFIAICKPAREWLERKFFI